MISLPLTDAAGHFLDLVNRVCLGHEEAVIIDHGKPVARLLPANGREMTGAELAASWSSLPELGLSEAEAFHHDLELARAGLPQTVSAWE